MNAERKKLTIPDLKTKKTAGERMAMVAVGEVLSAAWAERAGVDILGIGDSLGMTLYGHENTLAITVDQMIEHTRAVRRGAWGNSTLHPAADLVGDDVLERALSRRRDVGVVHVQASQGDLQSVADVLRQ